MRIPHPNSPCDPHVHPPCSAATPSNISTSRCQRTIVHSIVSQTKHTSTSAKTQSAGMCCTSNITRSMQPSQTTAAMCSTAASGRPAGGQHDQPCLPTSAVAVWCSNSGRGAAIGCTLNNHTKTPPCLPAGILAATTSPMNYKALTKQTNTEGRCGLQAVHRRPLALKRQTQNRANTTQPR